VSGRETLNALSRQLTFKSAAIVTLNKRCEAMALVIRSLREENRKLREACK